MAPRDYYADLELPRTADIQEIKKQFRKLALKYHPDRNPGRELEVNHQFQIISAANEVLSDPTQKAKYDATLGRSTARAAAASGTASGVRGNPWQNVSQQFPAPPRRTAQPTSHPTSGAKRWQDRFSSGVPPTAKQKASAEPSKASAAHAFESMRGGGYQYSSPHNAQRQERPVPPPPPSPSRGTRPPPPPPPPPRSHTPPRTEASRKRAEASFGTRKNGYYPHSGTGDEPPVKNHNYSTRINTGRSVPIPDPLAQFREKEEKEKEEKKDEADDEGGEEEEEKEEVSDTRKRTPYTSVGGERTNPFDGIPLHRTESAREPPRRASESQGTPPSASRQKFRSSSVPKTDAKDQSRSDQSRSSAETPREEQPDQTMPDLPRTRRKARMKTTRSTTRASVGDTFTVPPTSMNGQASDSQRQPSPPPPPIPPHPLQAQHPPPPQSEQPQEPFTSRTAFPRRPVNGVNGSSMYAALPAQDQHPRFSVHFTPPASYTRGLRASYPSIFSTNPGSTRDDSNAPSGVQEATITPFERQQGDLLSRLIQNQRDRGNQVKKPRFDPGQPCRDGASETALAEHANFLTSHSFEHGPSERSYAAEVPLPPSEPSEGLHRNSVDDINTNFVPHDGTTTWQFSAGGAEADLRPPSRSASRAGSRAGRRSPNKRPPLRKVDIPNPPPPPSAPQTSAGFDADDWADKFGPQIFVPQSGSNGSTSPTRPSNRASSRKARPAKATVGSAPTVEDGGLSDSDPLDWPGRKHQPKVARADSPQAMDIDTPLTAAEDSPIDAGFATARNIPVEPSRPEWRSGDVGSITPDAEQSEQERDRARRTRIPTPDNCQGSESTLRMDNMAAVPPLAYEATGLQSMTNLQDQLPFDSKASTEKPVKIPRAEPLQVPEPPAAPRLPSVVTVSGIQPDFAVWRRYQDEFQRYLKQWDKFNASVVEHFVTRRTHIDRMRNEKGYTFYGPQGEVDVTEYHNWIEQDHDVRRRWQAACEEHDLRFQEFMAFRKKMNE